MLTRNERIKYSGLFKQAYQKGKRLNSKHFQITYTQTLEQFQDSLPLTGFVISTKFSKRAVIRNRVKRQMREVYRLYRLEEKNVKKLKKVGLLVIGVRGDYEGFQAALSEQGSSFINEELESLLKNIESSL